MDSRLSRLLFVLLAIYAAVHFSYYYPQLPGVIASHFDARGTANGWQTKSVFFGVFVGMSVLSIVIGFGLAAIIGAVPMQLINLPNKQYWLAPERRTDTLEYLKAYFGWFSCSLYVVMIVAFDYAVQSNLHGDSPPSVSRLWFTLAAFMGFMLVWLIRLFRHFGQPRRDGIPLK
jgi:uncharacterized membrane protein